MQEATIKEHVQGTVTFEHYRDSALWYRTSETNLIFPVPIDDIGTATFHATEKALLFMRWIRRHLKEIAPDDTEAKRLYNATTDNDPVIHCNRFPTWDELDESDRQYWRGKVA